jgi:hypothetical protein
MRVAVMFFGDARIEFAKRGLEGKFLGLDVEGDLREQKAFFIHETASGIKRTEWPQAASDWEGIWHFLNS